MTNPSPQNGTAGEAAKVSLYKRREKLFVHYVGGYFQRLRLYTGWPLLLGYFLLVALVGNGSVVSMAVNAKLYADENVMVMASGCAPEYSLAGMQMLSG